MHLCRSNINLKIDIPYSLLLPYIIHNGESRVGNNSQMYRTLRNREEPRRYVMVSN